MLVRSSPFEQAAPVLLSGLSHNIVKCSRESVSSATDVSEEPVSNPLARPSFCFSVGGNLRRQDGLSATGRKGDCRAAFNVARQKCGRRHVNGSGSVRFRPVIQTHAGGNLKKSLVIALLAVAVASIGALTFAGDDAPVHRSVQALTSATAQISNLGMHTIPVSAHADKPSGAAPRIPCGTGTTGIF